MTEDLYEGCGISKLWATGPEDPFASLCGWHDAAYIQGSYAQQVMTRAQVDEKFLDMMLEIAAGRTKLIFKAYKYYYLTRLFGVRYWEGKLG